jgi:hypothetical protein
MLARTRPRNLSIEFEELAAGRFPREMLTSEAVPALAEFSPICGVSEQL